MFGKGVLPILSCYFCAGNRVLWNIGSGQRGTEDVYALCSSHQNRSCTWLSSHKKIAGYFYLTSVIWPGLGQSWMIRHHFFSLDSDYYLDELHVWTPSPPPALWTVAQRASFLLADRLCSTYFHWLQHAKVSVAMLHFLPETPEFVPSGSMIPKPGCLFSRFHTLQPFRSSFFAPLDPCSCLHPYVSLVMTQFMSVLHDSPSSVLELIWLTMYV